MEQAYEIVSIELSESPPDAESSNWYDYVIAFAGTTVLRGCRQGSLKEVKIAVAEIVGQLNERHCKKRGQAKKS